MIYIDEFCPSCSIENKNVKLLLNSNDFYECPNCNIQILYREYPIATVLNFKGESDFRKPNKTVIEKFFNSALAPVNPNSKSLSALEAFKDQKEFKEYLSTL